MTNTLSSRVALFASVACAVAWAVKSVAIAAAGGLGKSPFEGPLFLIGFLAALVASAAYGVSCAARRGTGVKVLAALGGLVGIVGLTLVVGQVVGVLEPAHPGWAWGEVNLWVAALAVLAATIRRPMAVPA